MSTSNWVFGVAVMSIASGLLGCGHTSQTPTQSAASYSPPAAEENVGEIHKRGGSKLIAEVGPKGGTLELANGARLTIPPGAFTSPVEITFSEGARTTAFANHEYERTVGPTLEIGPEAAIAAPLQVSVPISRLPDGFEESDLTLGMEVPRDHQRLEMQGVQTRWDYLPAQSQSGRAVAQIGSVPGFRVQFLVSKND